jgi:hypothetical protein
MSWDDFFTGANSTFDQGANIGSDVYLKKLAAKIQARNQDKQNLWESIQNDKKRKDDMTDWQTKQAQLTEQAKTEADTQTAIKLQMDMDKQKQATEEAAAAVDFRIKRLGADGAALADYPRTASGIKAVEAELARIEKDSEYKRKRADEISDRDYKAKGADGTTDARKPEQARQMAQDIIGKEQGSLPNEIKDLQSAINTPNTFEQSTMAPEMQSTLAQKQAELGKINANRPGGLPALTDSLRLGQGQYATPEQQNAQVSPEQAASVTQELATLKQQLAELLKSLGAKQ